MTAFLSRNQCATWLKGNKPIPMEVLEQIARYPELVPLLSDYVRRNPRLPLDFSGADLKGRHLNGAHLFRADFSGANMEGINLWGANLSGANLEKANLRNALLACTTLIGANLSGANLWDANIDRANLVSANLTDADLTHAYCYGVKASCASFRGAKVLPGLLDRLQATRQ